MARIRLFDYLQAYPFWLVDTTPTQRPPFYIFMPILGFQSITAPELNLETHEITPGNSLFRRHKVLRGQVPPITLLRGAQFFDSDYWRWIYMAAAGRSGIRRNLLLVHYMGYSVSANLGGAAAGVAVGAQVAVEASMGLSASAGVAAAQAAGMSFGAGIFKSSDRIPGRAWMLRGCLPTRYKVGSDFDAMSGEVSLMELDIQPEYFEEISLGAI